MFNDLASTLGVIPDYAAARTELHHADVSFETPDRNFAPAQPTVNIFLTYLIDSGCCVFAQEIWHDSVTRS